MLDRTFSTEQIQKNFSKVAWFYDHWGKLTERKAITEAISISGISDDQTVIDIGVGTGQIFERILKVNRNGFNFAIDLSPKMIAKAKEKLNPIPGMHLLAIGNAFHLPYKNQSFDFVFSSYVLDLLPENSFEKILSEFKRVLKKKGIGIVITMSMGKKWYNKIWFLAAKYFPSLLTNCRPVKLSKYIIAVGFRILKQEMISQSTFPSEIIKFRK